jgi:predicted ester cyclase
MSSTAEHYRAFIDEVCSPGDLQRLPEFLHRDVLLATSDGRGIDAFASMSAGFRAGFSDLSAEVLELEAAGAWVAARLRWTGTHDGDFAGLPPTGRRIDVIEFETVTIHNDLITEIYSVVDVDGLLSQLTT